MRRQNVAFCVGSVGTVVGTVGFCVGTVGTVKELESCKWSSLTLPFYVYSAVSLFRDSQVLRPVGHPDGRGLQPRQPTFLSCPSLALAPPVFFFLEAAPHSHAHSQDTAPATTERRFR